ncbi:hypothetical protein ACFTZF_34015 [Streptomyces mirabilis]|uniref:hypothetical protein n=1 Tax=Streptomyces mirabilis TaxID=68239 RepID=UPI003637A7B1
MNADEPPMEDQAAACYGMEALVGEVAQASAHLELQLRNLMEAPLDSKHASLVAAGLAVGDLIDTYTVLLKVNKEINEAQRAEGLALLSGLKDLLNTRHNLVHGVVAIGEPPSDEAFPEPVIQIATVVSKRRKPETSITVTKTDSEKTVKELTKRAHAILHWAAENLPDQLHRHQINS